jgi:hypothetical protein
MAGKGKKAAADKPKKSGKAPAKSASGKAGAAKAASAKPTSAKGPPAQARVTTIAKAAADKAADLASNPVVAEIVAATLVAAAAAIRDPKKARQIAAAAGDEWHSATKGAGQGGEALWQMAMDVGRRSLEALGADGTGAGKKAKKKKK